VSREEPGSDLHSSPVNSLFQRPDFLFSLRSLVISLFDPSAGLAGAGFTDPEIDTDLSQRTSGEQLMSGGVLLVTLSLTGAVP
jgi:hypothetical protein